ncbi:hypothetical protein ACA910_006037 [Epithemia clementina (nom. ined.)]
MASSALTLHSQEGAPAGGSHDELSAAEALLRVSPASGPNEAFSLASGEARTDGFDGLVSLAEQANALQSVRIKTLPLSAVMNDDESRDYKPPKGLLSAGLDALATLAVEARSLTSYNNNYRDSDPHLVVSGITSASPTSSSDDDSDSMPPPPPRSRRRSASNPEGMEKWDSYNNRYKSSRRHFVLPESILEEELAEASAAIQQQKRLQQQQQQQQQLLLLQGTSNTISKISADFGRDDDISGTSPNSVAQLSTVLERAMTSKHKKQAAEEEEEEGEPLGEETEDDDVDESELSPEELLKRARSRLLEDLSEGNMNGEKGVLTLPHSLAKYKAVYNRNGRIGIYTPAERAAIIARFNKKRQRRVWNKKIRYNCRKSLADRRLRVKGRFVKRSEQEQLAKEIQARVEQEVLVSSETKDNNNTNTINAVTVSTNCNNTKAQPNNHDNCKEREATNACGEDEEMPDVDDPEAGFAPTEDQPYRRLRRHTIT